MSRQLPKATVTCVDAEAFVSAVKSVSGAWLIAATNTLSLIGDSAASPVPPAGDASADGDAAADGDASAVGDASGDAEATGASEAGAEAAGAGDAAGVVAVPPHAARIGTTSARMSIQANVVARREERNILYFSLVNVPDDYWTDKPAQTG